MKKDIFKKVSKLIILVIAAAGPVVAADQAAENRELKRVINENNIIIQDLKKDVFSLENYSKEEKRKIDLLAAELWR